MSKPRKPYSPGPVDLGLVGLPAGAARGQHEVKAAVLEYGRRLSAAPDEYLQVLRLSVSVVRRQLGDVHVLIALAGIDDIRRSVIVLHMLCALFTTLVFLATRSNELLSA